MQENEEKKDRKVDRVRAQASSMWPTSPRQWTKIFSGVLRGKLPFRMTLLPWFHTISKFAWSLAAVVKIIRSRLFDYPS